MRGESANYWTRRRFARYPRRTVLRGSAAASAGMAGLALVGCGDDDNNGTSNGNGNGNGQDNTPAAGASPSPGTTPSNGGSGSPQRGGVWRTVLGSDPPSLDPYAVASAGAKRVTGFVYDKLMKVDAGPGVDPSLLVLVPNLAESVDISDDGLVYTVTLNQNAKWHPPVSRPIDADDIVFSWERMQGNTGMARSPAADPIAAYLDSVEKIDDLTVRLTLSSPRGDFLTVHSTTFDYLVMMPREADDLFDPAQQMVGTGPWIFENYTPGSVINFRRDPDWHFGPDAPYTDRCEVYIMAEYAQQLNQFIAGEIDSLEVQGQDIARVTDEVADAQFYVGIAPYTASYITFEGEDRAPDAPWRDPRVRKAISMSLDRDAMLDAAYDLQDIEALNIGAVRRWHNEIPALQTPYWLDPQGQVQYEDGDPTITEENQAAFAYDPQGARQLLEEAGYPDGFETQLHSTPSQYGEAFNILSELIQLYCAEIGVHLEFVDNDYASVYVNQIAREGAFTGLAHIPRGSGVLAQFELYYLPDGIRWNHHVTDEQLIQDIQDLLANRDPEDVRIKTLELQNYLNDKMYLVPMQLGAAGGYTAYQPNTGNVLDYQVASYNFGSEAIPFYYKTDAEEGS